MYRKIIIIMVFFGIFVPCSWALDTDDLMKSKFAVVVLGSGAPVATKSNRASASYLIFIDGKPTVLMDAGGGSFKSLARSGINIKDLGIILISHLHIDHMGDMSAMIKTSFFHARGAGQPRTHPFHIFGPKDNGVPFPGTVISQYPPASDYVNGLYDPQHGIERYLNIFSKAISGGIFSYDVHDVPSALDSGEQTIWNQDGLTIKSMAVNHGPVPAAAFRIEYGGKSIVYSGDTSSSSDNMIQLATDADLLIYDTAIMDDKPDGPNDKVFFALHTTPTRLGQVASAAKPAMLLLSHITPVTEPRLDEVKHIVRDQGYKGKIRAARDLQSIILIE